MQRDDPVADDNTQWDEIVFEETISVFPTKYFATTALKSIWFPSSNGLVHLLTKLFFGILIIC